MPKKTKDIINEAVDKLPVVIDANSLYNEFIGLTTIERVKEEDFVLKSILRGRSKNEIIDVLKKKYPEHNFNYPDLEKFLAKNQSIVRAMGKEVELSARRALQAKEECSEMLAGLALYTQDLIKDFRAEGDNTNTVAAIRALNTTLENYMKIEGITKPQEAHTVVNVVNAVSDTKTRVRDRIHRADFSDIIDGNVKE